MEPRLKWHKIILTNFMFYFNMEPRLTWNKILLAAKIILFHFRRGSMLKYAVNKLLESKISAGNVISIQNKKESIRWQDSVPPILGYLSCNNR